MEGNLGFFARGQPDLVITCSQVKLREPACASKFIKQLVDDRKRILSFNSESIEVMVIHDKSPSWKNSCI
jgi:hypothetical protein